MNFFERLICIFTKLMLLKDINRQITALLKNYQIKEFKHSKNIT